MSTYRHNLRSDDPHRNGSGPRVYAEMFVEPIKRVGVIPLVQKTGLSARTLYRITLRERTTISEATADRLCVALEIDFHALSYVQEKANA